MTSSSADPAPTAPARLSRDRLTVTLYGTFMMWGWFLYSFNPSVPLLMADLEISRAQAGLHGTALAVGSVLAALVTPRLVLRFGRREVLAGASAGIVVGAAGLLLGPTLPWTLSGILVLALGANIAISCAQVALVLHHGRVATAAVTEANGVGSSVGLLGPLAVGACVAIGWGWRPAVAVTAVLAVVTAFLVRRVPFPKADVVEQLEARDGVAADTTVSEGGDRAAAASPRSPSEPSTAPARATSSARSAGRARLRPHTLASILFLTAILAAIALENVTTYWAADLIVDQTGAPASIATAATAGLVGGMSLIRFVVGPLSLRVRPALLLAASFLVAIAGWAVLWTATVPAVALAGLFLAGLGYGAQYPLSISLLLRAAGGAADQAQARATLAGGVAMGLAPFALGALADAVGPHRAFLLVPAIAVLGAVVAFAGARVSRTGA